MTSFEEIVFLNKEIATKKIKKDLELILYIQDKAVQLDNQIHRFMKELMINKNYVLTEHTIDTMRTDDVELPNLSEKNLWQLQSAIAKYQLSKLKKKRK